MRAFSQPPVLRHQYVFVLLILILFLIPFPHSFSSFLFLIPSPPPSSSLKKQPLRWSRVVSRATQGYVKLRESRLYVQDLVNSIHSPID
ncbi:hypothetical protein EDD21DRAFT_168321 [Dissophora ornata]|nr:hypothetical protein EDD21DRAFT_168321 [Dissophora ornata]